MILLLTFIHIIACIFLVLIILIQPAKGGDFGSVFGGGPGQSLFGSSGGKTIIEKITTVTAVVFMLTSLLLATVPRTAGKSALQKAAQEDASKMPVIPSIPGGLAPMKPAETPQQPAAVPAPVPAPQQPAPKGQAVPAK